MDKRRVLLRGVWVLGLELGYLELGAGAGDLGRVLLMRKVNCIYIWGKCDLLFCKR